MHPVQKHLFATNFKDLAGAKIEGTIALSDELINLGLGDLLSQLPNSSHSATSPGSTKQASSVAQQADPQAMLQLLTVQKLRYRTAAGTTMLDLKVSLEPKD